MEKLNFNQYAYALLASCFLNFQDDAEGKKKRIKSQVVSLKIVTSLSHRKLKISISHNSMKVYDSAQSFPRLSANGRIHGLFG